MHISISMILLILFTFKGVRTDKDIIPVFLMDLGGVMDHLHLDANPFFKTSTAYFASIIHDAIKRSEVVIVFVEDHFSIEDISVKDNLGTPYHHLHQDLLDNKVKYFPKVIDPYKLLNQIFSPQQFNVFYIGSDTKLQMFDGHFKHYFIFFRDGKNETRAAALRRHDLIMRKMYFEARYLAKGPVVAFYTGKTNPALVEKIEFIPIEPVEAVRNPGVLVVTGGALFRFVGVFAATHHRRALFNQVPIVAEEVWTSGSLSTKMAYTDFELEFNFSFKDHGWVLDTVALLEGGEEVGRTDMAVGARWNWAYYCGEPLVVINTRDGSSVTISEYKIQPMRQRRRSNYDHYVRGRTAPPTAALKAPGSNVSNIGVNTMNSTIARPIAGVVPPSYFRRDGVGTTNGGGDNVGGSGDRNGGGGDGVGGAGDGNGGGGDGDTSSETFGDTVNCGPYYTSGILACLLIVFICFGILTSGLLALYSVNSNDRYDDPHGKPLVLGAER